MMFLGQFFEKLEHEQDRQTDRCYRMHYHIVFAGGNNDKLTQ